MANFRFLPISVWSAASILDNLVTVQSMLMVMLSAGVEEVILMSQILVLLAASVERGHTLAQSKWITQSSAGGVILMVKVPFLQSFSSHI